MTECTALVIGFSLIILTIVLFRGDPDLVHALVNSLMEKK